MKYSEGVVYKVSRSTEMQFRVIKRSGNAVMAFCPELLLYEIFKTYPTVSRYLTSGEILVEHEHFPGQGKRNVFTDREEAEREFMLL
ncbi:MAG TPA: hypothetical protein VMW76_09035 [Bacteroidales bacterium]|nr:hypothetical protein [Bacteroidales bacterium]